MHDLGASLVARMVKHLPVMQETQAWGWEDPLEKRMAILSSILAWSDTIKWLNTFTFHVWSCVCEKIGVYVYMQTTVYISRSLNHKKDKRIKKKSSLPGPLKWRKGDGSSHYADKLKRLGLFISQGARTAAYKLRSSGRRLVKTSLSIGSCSAATERAT